MSGPSDHYNRTTLPSESPAVPISSQPFADIETHYNKLVRGMVELWACINGANAGVDVNGSALQDYSASASLGLLPRLTAIEDQGKIADASALQLGSDISAGDRGVRFMLGASSVYKELQYNNASSLFRLVDQDGALQRLQGATPTSSADYATKQYVDGVITANALAKYAVFSPPTWASTSTFTIDSGYAADSTGSIIMGHGTQKTVSIATAGLNGVADSNASKGVSGGTISVTNGSATITGSGTTFTTDFIVGDFITTAGGQALRIVTVTNNTSMTAASNFSVTESGVSYHRGGVRETNSCGLNLYMVSDVVGNNVGYLLSTRNVLSGDTLVDLPIIQKSGSVSVSSGANGVTGSSTAFLTEFVVGQQVVVKSGSNVAWGTVASIQSNTQMTISGTWGLTASGASVYVAIEKYRQLPFNPLVDGSANLAEFRCSGFPWSTEVLFTKYDGSSLYTLVSASTATSNQTYDLWSNRMCPKQAGVVLMNILCGFVNQTNAPGYFSVGGNTTILSAGLYSIWPRTTTYNGLGSLSYGNGILLAQVDLTSAGLVYYVSSNTNASGSISMYGWKYTLWKG